MKLRWIKESWSRESLETRLSSQQEMDVRVQDRINVVLNSLFYLKELTHAVADDHEAEI